MMAIDDERQRYEEYRVKDDLISLFSKLDGHLDKLHQDYRDSQNDMVSVFLS